MPNGVPLASFTTFRLGGPARTLCEYGDEEELVGAVAAADIRREPLLILGGGSNLLIGDDGFVGTVLAVRSRGVSVGVESRVGVTVEVQAGEPWDDLVLLAVTSGWAGVECLSGIPGLTGATPIQNVGAYGQEVADTIVSVRAYDRRSREVVQISAADCGFGYRTSRFKRERAAHVLLSVTFRWPLAASSAPIRYVELARALDVPLGASVPLATARDAVLDLRRRKGMVLDPADHDTWSAGSFFTNPVVSAAQFARLSERAAQRWGEAALPPAYPAEDGRVKTSAAWLVERAGFTRGYGTGAARVSTRHALALTHRGGGTSADLVALAREIRAGVQAQFDIVLEPEPVLVGVTL